MTERITKVCGHDVEFTPKGDQWDDARREKYRAKDCLICSQAKQKAAQPKSGRVKRGQEVKLLSEGTRIVLYRDAAEWAGEIDVAGITIRRRAPGLMGLVTRLARASLQKQGRKLQGKAP